MIEISAIGGETSGLTEDFVWNLTPSPDFANDGIVFAALSSGLAVSRDRGLTWQSLYGSLKLSEPLPTSAVALSPAFATDQRIFAGVPGAVLRSHNGGQTWESARLASPAPAVTALAVSPHFEHDDIVFAGTAEDGVFRTKDRGARWGGWNFGLLDLNIICLGLSPRFAGDNTLFAGTESGIFRSTNGGRAWRELEFSEDWAPVQCLAVSPHYVEDGTLVCGTESYGLFMSHDWGETWEPTGERAISGSVLGVTIAAGMDDRLRLLVLTDNTLFRSDDAGASWLRAYSATDTQFTALAVPAGLESGAPVFMGTTDGRIMRYSLIY